MNDINIETLQKVLSAQLEQLEAQYGNKRMLAKIYFYLFGWIGLLFFMVLMLAYVLLNYIKFFTFFFIVYFLIETEMEGLSLLGTILGVVAVAVVATIVLYGPVMYSESYFANIYKKSLYPSVFDAFFQKVDYLVDKKKDINLDHYKALPLYQYDKPVSIAQLDIDDAAQIIHKDAIIYFHEVPANNLLHLNIVFNQNHFDQMILGQSSREETKFACFSKKDASAWFAFEKNEAFSLHLPNSNPSQEEIKKESFIKKLMAISSEYEYPIHFAVNSNKNIQIAIEYKSEGFLELSSGLSLIQSTKKVKKSIGKILDASNRRDVNEEVVEYLFEEMSFLQAVIDCIVE